MTINSETGAASVLRKHGLRPRHSLGQNFLDDPEALQQVAEAAALSPDDVVLEIGTGIGSLTRRLALNAKGVVGVEVDAALAAICRDELQSLRNVVIVQGDVLNLTPRELGLLPGYVVAANIPYNITSPILRHLLESEPRPRRLVLTVQEEVADRVCARPPHMSVLAVSVQVHGVARKVGKIRAGAFHPKPKVDSAILRIDCYEQCRVPPTHAVAFFRTVRAGFIQPRKMLRNSMSAGMKMPVSEIEALLQRASIDVHRRAETLTIEEWMRLAEEARAYA
jgi:16S rRNA (adenine1518-N6/adenine1519-N6)-dimethyltransferase